jgi:hypothetical protein
MENDQTLSEEEKKRLEKDIAGIQTAKAELGLAYRPLTVTMPDEDDDEKSGVTFGFRRPTDAEWFRYRTAVLDPNPQTKARALHIIVIPCCIYPPQKEIQSIFERVPGFVDVLGGELAEFGGHIKAKKVKRL